MSDDLAFFAFLAGLYVMESLGWSTRDAVVFRSSLRGVWRPLDGSCFHGHERGGLFLLNPLPPLGAGILCQLWPVSLSPEGVFAYVAQAFNPGQRFHHERRFYRFEDFDRVEAQDRSVLLDSRLFLKASSAPMAEFIARKIKHLRRLPAEKRAGAIDRICREITDTSAIEQRMALYHAAGNVLMWQCTLLLIFLFGFAPWLVWRMGLLQTWFGLLLSVMVLAVLTIWSFRKAHRLLYPEDKAHRRSHIATMIVFVPAVIRSHAILTRHLLAHFHPLAVARVLCSEEAFRSFASSLLRDMEHPLPPVCPEEVPEAAATVQFFRECLRDRLNEVVRDRGLDPVTLLAGPERDGDDNHSYCPRCHCQFLLREGRCEACGGMELVAFDKATARSRASASLDLAASP